MSNDLIKANDTQVTRLTAKDLIDQVTYIQEIMGAVMRDGEHYGTIPGCGSKKTLLKSGAEKLSFTFRLRPEYDIQERDLGNGHREYRVITTMININTNESYGQGVGVCSTMESKYRYRNSERKCPSCGKETIIKGKTEYGGGWLCYGKKGGCGEKFKDGDPAIEQQEVGKIENKDVADQYNTCLKMAKKRSHVDAVLTCTAASDIFTQDLEELVEEAEAIDSRYQKKEQAKTQPQPENKKEQPIEDAKVVEETTGDPLDQKISAATWTKLCKDAMLCKDLDGKPLGVSTMFDRAKAVYGVKLGTDLTGKMVETIENEWFKEWENGAWKK